MLILLFAAGVSAYLREWADAAVIAAIVVGSAAISFFQEYGASRAVAALRARLAHIVAALRDGHQVQIPAETLVPGDVVLLTAGNLVPADGVLLAAKDCYITEAALTGETFPVTKRPGPVAADTTLGWRSNCALLGTTVHSGTASLLVVHTLRRRSGPSYGSASPPGAPRATECSAWQPEKSRRGRATLARTSAI